MLRERRAFTVPDAVWASFLCLTTNRRIVDVPTPREDAFAFVDAVCAQPRFRTSRTGGHQLELVRRMCDEGDASGDLVPDAVIAAIALALEATVVSFARDFARFRSVTHRRPGS